MKTSMRTARPIASWALQALVLLQALTSSACQGGVSGGSTGAPGTAAPAPTATLETPVNPNTHVTPPASDLAEFDTRSPVPLLPVMAWHQKQQMMDHLLAIQGIISAAAEKNWNAVAQASQRLEASEAERQSCRHMGSGASGFTELALSLHDEAEGIGKAARAADRDAVLAATARTVAVCTTCHALYRQELVGEDSWLRRTGAEHKPMHHPAQ